MAVFEIQVPEKGKKYLGIGTYSNLFRAKINYGCVKLAGREVAVRLVAWRDGRAEVFKRKLRR